MLGQPIVKQLTDMRLWGMLNAYNQQIQEASYNKLSFEERISLMVEQEYTHRQNNSITRLLAQAKLVK